MAITVELGPDVEEQVRAAASAVGVPVDEYVSELVRAVVIRPAGQPSLAEFERDWQAFSEGLDHVPPLPPEALTREALYQDHD